MSSTTITANQIAADYIAARDAIDGPCLTCSFACDGGGRDYHRHSKRFRNALREWANDEALSEKYGEALEAVLKRAEALAGEESRWGGDYEGICVHVSGENADLLRLPYAPPEISQIADRFEFRPAADILPTQVEMLVLHLSFKSPGLFLYDGQKASVFGEIELPESVYSFSETEVLDPGQRAHVRVSKNRSDPALVRQGMAATKSPRELNEPVFLQQVSNALCDLEESKTLPLVVVGDEQLLGEFVKFHEHPSGALFREARQDPHPDEAEIVRICQDLTVQMQRDAKAEALKTLRSVDQGSERFNDNLKECFEAAQQARIQVCAVSAADRAWCRYDENGALSSAHPDQEEDAFEVLDRIYAETVMKGGEVAVVPADKVPGGNKVAAIFKW